MKLNNLNRLDASYNSESLDNSSNFLILRMPSMFNSFDVHFFGVRSINVFAPMINSYASLQVLRLTTNLVHIALTRPEVSSFSLHEKSAFRRLHLSPTPVA